MTIADFYADIRDAIGRGTANDARLPTWAQATINRIENMKTMQWMRQTKEIPVAAGADSNVVPLGWSRIKAFNWVKFGKRSGVGSQQTVQYGAEVNIIDPRQLDSVDLGYAGFAYLDGLGNLVLDALPQEASTLFVNAWCFTDWSEYDESDTPPILVRHYAAMFSGMMMTAAGRLRDGERLGGIWSGQMQQDYAAMFAADTDLEWSARRKLRLGMNDADA